MDVHSTKNVSIGIDPYPTRSYFGDHYTGLYLHLTVECCAPASLKFQDPSEWQPLPTTRRRTERANVLGSTDVATRDGHVDANVGRSP